MDHITQLIKSSASTITHELEYLYLEIKIQFCHRNVGNVAPHTHTRAQGVFKIQRATCENAPSGRSAEEGILLSRQAGG